MNISQILTLDDGVSGLGCTGAVSYVKPPENKVGTKNGKDYDFWTQFIVVKDETGDIGVSLNLGDSSVGVSKGQTVLIEKGTVGSYTKDGKLRKSLRASLAENKIANTNLLPTLKSLPPAARQPIADTIQKLQQGKVYDNNTAQQIANENALTNATNRHCKLAELTKNISDLSADSILFTARFFSDFNMGKPAEPPDFAPIKKKLADMSTEELLDQPANVDNEPNDELGSEIPF